MIDKRAPADSDAVALFQNYQDMLRAEKLVERFPRKRWQGAKFVGSQACVDCHAEQAAQWRKTRHAYAFETLKKVGRDSDPECVRCHVVGFGSLSGFRSARATPSRASVGCECCHGPGSEHMDDPEKPWKQAPSEKCLRCHTPRKSPRFNIIEYLPKARH